MDNRADRAARFMALHQQEHAFVVANAWDVGSAKLLEALGFDALATTSAGYAATLGRLDYAVSREEAVAQPAAAQGAAPASSRKTPPATETSPWTASSTRPNRRTWTISTSRTKNPSRTRYPNSHAA